MDTPPKAKLNSVDKVHKEVSKLQKAILLSKKKSEITIGFKGLICIITGKCVCDLCKEWDRDTYLVYEFGRCLVPTRFMQLVKELHFKSKRWEYVRPMYRELYSILYEDLNPDTEVMSNGDMENQKCRYELPKGLMEAASKQLEKVQQMHATITKKNQKMRCAMCKL